MKKRGMTHVEIILSFIIFITAIGFALYFFSPIRTSRLVDTSLEYVDREITENVSVILKTYSIIVNNTNNPGDHLTVEINDACGNINNVIIAENVSGNILKTEVENNGNNTCISGNKQITIKNDWPEDKDFIYIKASEGIKESSDDLTNPYANLTYYKISTTDIRRLFSERKLMELNESYYMNYFALKKEFNIPGRVNFGFKIILPDKEINAVRFIPSGLDIYSKIKRIEVLRESGKVEYADIILKVW